MSWKLYKRVVLGIRYLDYLLIIFIRMIRNINEYVQEKLLRERISCCPQLLPGQNKLVCC